MNMKLRSLLLIFYLGVLLSTTNVIGSGAVVCNGREREALLTFKHDLKDPLNKLSSWNDSAGNTDCCRWNGVVCNNKTDPSVVQLQLQSLSLSGELNPSLLELKHLSHLDLSFNDFNISIPPFLGSLQKLRYLNLAGYSNLNGDTNRTIRHLDWLSHLYSLEYLNMRFINLSKASNWLHVINMLPSLLELNLRECGLVSIPSLSYVNFTSLKILDLSDNHFKTYLPEWLFNLTDLVKLHLSRSSFEKSIPEAIGNLTSLTHLYFYNNELEGEIPKTLGNLCNLEILDLFGNKLRGEISGSGFLGNSSGCIAGNLKTLQLSFNQLSGPLPDKFGRLKNLEYLSLQSNSFSGSIPSSIGRLSLLKELNLDHNKLTGSLPNSIGHLSELETLGISDNTLEGVVTEIHLANLTKLKTLEMHSMNITLNPDWVPPFQLEIVKFRACQLGPQLVPKWLRTQKHIVRIDLSRRGILDTVPTWFWNMSSQFEFLDLSYNRLHGELPHTLYGARIYLNSNWFNGRPPIVSSNIGELDLSNNLFSGPISDLLCNPLNNETNSLRVLDLSRNLFSGELPKCWFYWKSLKFIRLGSNNITGKIPSSMGSLFQLKSLNLGSNFISGEVPSSLRNCTELKTIDLGENTFTGSIPIWMGESLPNLISLRLRSNRFNGGIPQEFCHLSSLQLLDLAHNNLNGSIPRCFSNFSAMASRKGMIDEIPIDRIVYDWVETVISVRKGRQIEYADTLLLTLATSMDLSNNSLSGEIPEELTSLFELQSLNLSDNHFTGKIPDKIGRMRSLESLDFSKNRLSGSIPQSMRGLNFLSHLNLSYNNLSGKIPLSTQLQSFTELSYMGNQGLCGPPALKNCSEDEQPQVGDNSERAAKEHEDDNEIEKNCFYISLTLGFVIAFWGFWGALLVNKSWRFAYFGFLESLGDKFYNFCNDACKINA